MLVEGTIRFGARNLARLQALLPRYPAKQAALLPTLRLAEDEWGNIRVEHLKYVADILELPPAHVWGVYTFYTHYRRPEDGQYVLWVCSTLPCQLRGSEVVHDHLCRKLGVASGETTKDGRFTVKKAECLGGCDKAPVMAINEKYFESRPDWATEEFIRELDKVLENLP